MRKLIGKVRSLIEIPVCSLDSGQQRKHQRGWSFGKITSEMKFRYFCPGVVRDFKHVWPKTLPDILCFSSDCLKDCYAESGGAGPDHEAAREAAPQTAAGCWIRTKGDHMVSQDHPHPTAVRLFGISSNRLPQVDFTQQRPRQKLVSSSSEVQEQQEERCT